MTTKKITFDPDASAAPAGPILIFLVEQTLKETLRL